MLRSHNLTRMLMSVSDGQIQLLVEMDTLCQLGTYFNTKNGRLLLAMILHYIASNFFVIWDDFKSNHKISNQIEIKSHVF